MKAIAFAIICAAYLLVTQSEVAQWGKSFLLINAFVNVVCIFGFWWAIFFEENGK